MVPKWNSVDCTSMNANADDTAIAGASKGERDGRAMEPSDWPDCSSLTSASNLVLGLFPNRSSNPRLEYSIRSVYKRKARTNRSSYHERDSGYCR